jgi:hypothetical protein
MPAVKDRRLASGRVSFALDHVIVHVADLEAAIADWRALGLEPTDGGFHPTIGTRNAIVRFPDRTFLELLTIEDREKVREFAPAMLAFAELHPDGPIYWCVRTDDIVSAADAVRGAGLKAGEIREGRGVRDSGKIARWRTLIIEEPAFPFLIEYAGPPTSEPAPSALPISGLDAVIVQGVSASALTERLAVFGSRKADHRVQLDRGEVVLVEVADEHPGVIGAELVVADEPRASAMLAERRVDVIDGWVSDRRLHGIALRLLAPRGSRA